MEFFVAGASAIQIGTANYYDPTITMKILDELPAAVAELGTHKFANIPGTIKPN
jgi:dihydroorotate dehydrogenase (NAD+) catalytic subunit